MSMMDRNMDHFGSFVAVVSGVTLLYIFHSVFYTSHISFKSHTVFDSQRHLPGSVYLMTRYLHESLRKKRGQMWKNKDTKDKLVFTLINCKVLSHLQYVYRTFPVRCHFTRCHLKYVYQMLVNSRCFPDEVIFNRHLADVRVLSGYRYDAVSLRRFCSVSGYGWDYPDSVFRDIPMCYPEFLCTRLLTMIVCSERFNLSPLGLLRVREVLRLTEPVDELKRGTFSLQARVLEYRTVSAGVEVDLTLTASRHQQTVWTTTLTLLSPNNNFRPEAQPDFEIAHDPVSERCISLAVPWSSGVRCAWVFGDLCPLDVFTRPSAHMLWMFSRCMAEMEKHNGVEVVRAPLTVSVRYKQPVSFPRKFTIRVSENTSQTSSTASFSMEDHRTGTLYLSGQIKQQSKEKAE